MENADQRAAEHLITRDWPVAKCVFDHAFAEKTAAIIFQRSETAKPAPVLRAFVRGTAFQVRVWRALLQIPCGSAVSYAQVAVLAGNPNASRATGTAVGQNELSFIIPCHRVIRQTGVIGHYRWGRERKRAMLAWEGARHAADGRSADFAD